MGKHLLSILIALLNTSLIWASCGSDVNTVIPQNAPDGISNIINNSGTANLLGQGSELEEVCVLIEHGIIGDLNILLTSPEGTTINVCSSDAITGDFEYTDDFGVIFSGTEVCFSMNTLQSITDYYGTAFGDWQPIEPFTTFNGQDPNGEWTLTVIDDGQYFFPGTFISWSIGFSDGDCIATVGLPEFITKDVEVSIDGLENIYCINEDSIAIQGFPGTLESIMDTIEISETGFNIDSSNVAQISTIDVQGFDSDYVLIDPSNISVSINIQHEWMGDLSIGLITPCDETIILINRPGYPNLYNVSGSWSDLMGTYTFSDTASVAFPQAQEYDVVPEGFYLPEQNFAEILGCPLNGNWSLIVVDHYYGEDYAALMDWSLNLSYVIDQSSTTGIFTGPGITDHGDSLSTATFNPALANIGENDITYTYTHVNGVAYSHTQTVVIQDAPILEAIPYVNICDFDGELNLDDYNPSVINEELSLGTYTWHNDSLLQNAIDPMIDDNGIYYVEFVSEVTGCSDVVAFEIGGDPNPEISIWNDGPFCLGDTVYLYSEVITTASTIFFEWVGPDNYWSDDSIAVVTPNDFEEGFYSLIVTTDGCVSDTVSMEILYHDLPSDEALFIDPDLSICINDSIATYSIENTFQQYIWHVDDGIIIEGGGLNDSSITIDWNVGQAGTEGEGTLWAEIIDDNYPCPFTSEVITISYFNVPQINLLVGTNQACALQDTSFYQIFATPGILTWSVEGGNVIGGGTGDDDFVSVIWENNNSTFISASLVNLANCSVELVLPINVFDQPTPTFITTSEEVCASDTIEYAIDETFLNHVWDIEGGTIIEGGGYNDTTATVIWHDNDTGFLSVEVLTLQGCINTVIDTITINTLDAPTFEEEAINSMCQNDTLTYSLTDSYENYEWQIGNQIQWIAGGQSNDDFITITSNSAALFDSLSVRVTDENGCSNTTTQFIEIFTSPSLTLDDPILTVCANDTITYTTLNDTLTTYNWNVENGDILVESGNMITIVWGDMSSGTIMLEGEDNNTCSNNISQEITINSLPNPQVSSSIETACINLEITYTLDQLYDNIIWDVSGFNEIIGENNLQEVTVLWTDSVDAQISVMVTNNDCSNTLTENIEFQEANIPTFEDYNESICLNGDTLIYTLEEVFDTYDWNISDNSTIIEGGNINDNFISLVWTSSDTGSITISITDENTCIATSSIQILLNELPNIDLANPVLMVCANDTVSYVANNDLFEDYSWTINNGEIIFEEEDSIQVVWNDTTEGTILLEVTDSNNCTNNIGYEVSINPQPNPILLTELNPICKGTEATYILTQTYQEHYWEVTGGTIIANGGITDNFVTILWDDSNDTTLISVQVLNNGCEGSLTQPIEVVTASIPIFEEYDSILCTSGDTITYEIIENNYQEYDWNISATGTVVEGGQVEDNTIGIVWTGETGTLSVTVLDENGCYGFNNIDITILPLLNASLDNPILNVCEGESNVLYVADNLNYDTYEWNIDNGTIDINDGSSIMVTWENAGTGTLSLMVTDSSGCANTVVHTINIESLPDPNFLNPLDGVCQLASNVVYTLEEMYASHEFSVEGGVIISPIDSTNNSLTINWGVGPLGTITAIVTNEIGCIDSTSLAINIDQPTAPDFAIESLEVCSQDTGVVYALPSGLNFETYEWDVTNGTITAGGGINDTSVTVAWNEANNINGTVSVAMVDASDCYYLSDTLSVLINPLPIPTFAMGEDTVCAMQQGVLYTLNETYESYEWKAEDGMIVDGGGINDNFVVVDWASSANGQVEVLVTDEKGCQQNVILNITILPLPDLAFVNPITAACEASNIIEYTLNNTFENHTWTIENGTITAGGGQNDNAITVDWGLTQEGFIAVEVLGENGCINSIEDSVKIYEELLPILEDLDTIVCGTDIPQTYMLTENFNTYTWNITNGQIEGGGTNIDNYVVVNWDEGIDNGSINVDVADVNGCSGSNTIGFELYPTTELNFITPQNNVCLGQEITYSIENSFEEYTWILTGGTQIAGGTNTDSSITVLWNTEGDGSIQITAIDENGCMSELVEDITISPAMNPVLAEYANTICGLGNTVTYTVEGSFDNYTWDASNGNTVSGEGNQNTITVEWNNLGMDSVSVTVTNAANCMETIIAYIEVKEELPLSFLNPSINLCGGSIETYTIDETNESYETYTWDIQGGSITEGGDGFNFVTIDWNNSDASSGLVEVSVENANGCTANYLESITIHPIVEALVTPVNPTICVGSSVELMVSEIDNDATLVWEANDNLIINGNGETATATPTIAETYLLYVTATSGCTDTVEVNVDVLDELSIDYSLSNENICLGTGDSVNVMPSGASDYTLTPTTNINQLADGSFNILPASPTEYTLIGTSGMGCSDTLTFMVNVATPPTVDLPIGIVIGSCLEETVSPTVIATGNYDIVWSPTEGISDTGILSPLFDPDTTTTYTLTITDENGCTSSDSITVTPLPVSVNISAGDSLNICEGSTAQVILSGALNYTWFPMTNVTAINDSTFEIAAEGIQEYVITGTDGFGCEATNSLYVQESGDIEVSANADNASICVNEETQLMATGGLTYSWSPAESLSDASSPTPIAFPEVTTTYTVTISQGAGCTDVATVMVEVMPLTNVEAGTDGFICPNESWTLNEATANNYTTLQWTANVAGTFDDANSLNPTFTPDPSISSGTVELTLTAVSEHGCESVEDVVFLTIEETAPTISFEEDLIEVCEGDLIELTAFLDNEAYQSLVWTGGNDGFQNANSLTTTYQTEMGETGMFDLEFTVTTGCHEVVSSLNLIVHPMVEVNILAGQENISMPEGSSIGLQASGDFDENYVWSPSEGLSCTDCANPIASPEESTVYYVTSTAECSDTARIQVVVEEGDALLLPTAFSPNADGNNDYFHPLGQGYEVTGFKVFNRYGQLVFEGQGKDMLGWDGYFNGKQQENGVYTFICQYYLIDEPEYPKQKEGNVTLVR